MLLCVYDQKSKNFEASKEFHTFLPCYCSFEMSTSYKGPRAAKASATATQKPSQESKNTGNDDAKNKQSTSKQPDLTKYAKYLQDDDTFKFDEASYKPTIRAERHQVGYSASLNQRRNRVNGDPASGVNEETGRRSRATNRPHIRSYSLNRPSTSATSGNSSSRTSAFQKNAEAAQPTSRQHSRLGEDLPTKSRISRADVLEEERESTLPKTGLFSGVFPSKDSKETMSSSSSSSSSCNGENKESSRPFSTKSTTGGTSSRASRSGRTVPGEDVRGRFQAESKSRTNESVPPNEPFDTKPSKVGSTREPSKRYFATVSDFDAQEASEDNAAQTSSTPKSRSKTSNASDTEFPQENAAPRKTYLSPESCWNSKYFPPPYESSSSDWTSHYSNHLDPSSCRESPIRGNQESEFTEPRSSPRPSYRNGIFEHLKSQGSRRSHSLDSRNRTPSRESVSPSPQSGKSRRRSRIEQMNSLNESNFESKSAFKDHLLNLTMNKDEYEDIMSDFKNGSIVEELNKVGIDDQPEIVPEIVVNEVNDGLSGCDSNSNNKSEDAFKESGNENPEQNVCASKDTVDQTTKEDIVGSDVPDSKPVATEEGAPTVNIEVSDAKDSKQETNDVVDDDANPKKQPPENSFKLLEELIQAAREKYSSPDLRKTSESQVILEPILSEEIMHKWRFQKTEFGIPTSMGITSDGCVVVADYGNSCLEYFSNSGDFEHKIEGVKPFGIVINKKDNIFVGDRRGKAIRIFDKFGADVAQWESKTFGWISGLALLQNGNLVICDRDRCKVGIYTVGGDIVTEFGSYGMNNSQICMADFIAVDSKDRIIVADSGNHCLKLFDTNGKAIGKIGSRGTDNGCLEWPKGICVDRNDNIIVADMHNNRVSMFSTTGDFVQQLLSMTPNPYNVCYGQEAGILGTLHYSLKGFSQYDVYGF